MKSIALVFILSIGYLFTACGNEPTEAVSPTTADSLQNVPADTTSVQELREQVKGGVKDSTHNVNN